MIRSAMAAMIAAALEAAPAYAQTQGQPQTPSPNYPYQEVKRPPAGEVIRDVVQDAVDAAAARAREERRRERERRERERLEWERQQAQIPPTYSGTASRSRPAAARAIVPARPRAQSRARAGTGPADADKARYAKTGRSDRARRFAASEACAARDGAALPRPHRVRPSTPARR